MQAFRQMTIKRKLIALIMLTSSIALLVMFVSMTAIDYFSVRAGMVRDLRTLANVIGKGGSSFSRLFGLACNISIVNFGIGSLLIGLIAARVGSDAISTQRDLLGLMPSLARLAPSNAPKLAALLAAINPFQIWSFVLIVVGLRTMTRLAPPYVATVALVVGFGSALFAAAFAR